MNVKLKVIEVMIDGEKKYVSSTSIFGKKPTTNPLEATNYIDNEFQLKHDIEDLVIKGDTMYARSGLRIDEAPVIVEMEIQISFQELKRTTGRLVRT